MVNVNVEGISEEVINCLNNHMFKNLRVAWVFINHDLIVQECSDNWSDYGFEEFNLGDDSSSVVDFFVGLDTTQRLNLPIIVSPSGKPVSATMIPMEGGMTVAILDASLQMSYRSRLQQAANDNELLVTKQRELMKMLKHASMQLETKNQQLEEANRLQTSFLSGVSHEFRTPLASIIGYTEKVQANFQKFVVNENAKLNGEDLSFFSRNQDHLRAANRSSQHLLSLVENLLDHGKIDSNEIVIRPKAIDLKEVFEDVWALIHPLCEVKEVNLSIKVDEKRPDHIFIDDSRLRQCLINLIGNAVKFTDDGGVSVLGLWKDEKLIVTIEDTGLGITKHDLEKIRLPFWQVEGTGKVGTGLGLTITEKIIDLMGGFLRIESVYGEGTKVTFEMLAPKVDSIEELEQTSELMMPLKVLLAEDDTDIADLVVMLLVDSGVNVTHAKNGAEAVNLVKKNDYDLILMDLNMPIVNGYQAIEQLRSQGFKTPIVVMSAAAIDDESHKVKQLECDAYLVKPVSVDDILRVANQLVDN